MSRLRALSHGISDRLFGGTVQPTVVDEGLYDRVKDAAPRGPLVKARPKKDKHGIEAGPDLIDTLYTVRTGPFGVRNRSPEHSFELWYDEGKVQFKFYPSNATYRSRYEDQLMDKYPGTSIEPDGKMFPTVEQGDFIAGARMDLRKAFWYPIKVPGGVVDFDRDPYGALTSAMVIQEEQTSSGEIVRGEDARMLVQVAFKPAKRSWSQGGIFGTDCETRGHELKEGRLKGGLYRELTGQVEIQDASRKLQQAGELIAKQRGEPGFYTRIRVLAISPYKEVARRQVEGVAEVMETYYNAVTEQGLETVPLRGPKLKSMIERAASRQIAPSTRRKMSADKTLLTAPEIAGLAHLPAEDISTPNIDWTFAQTSPGLPADLPQFEGGDEAST